jgi:hypothetical protein
VFQQNYCKSNKFTPFLSNNQYKEASEQQEYMILISIKLQLRSYREQGENDRVDTLKVTYIETNLSKVKDLPAG